MYCTMAHLKVSANAALPTSWEPKVMQRTSAVGHCSAAKMAARLATDPPTQYPTDVMRRGVTPPVATCLAPYTCCL